MDIDTDFLVIGSGLAGYNAALRLAAAGRVVLISKRELSDNATSWAQGGMASVMDDSDDFDLHVRDTLEAGAGLCDPDVVRSIVQDGPAAVYSLQELGVEFDRRDEGFDLAREGGHSKRRILHYRDATGREIDRALRERILANQNIKRLSNHIAIDLITLKRGDLEGEKRCLGAYVLETRTGKILAIRARGTLLATGGAGKVYLYTSNPDVATGDGIAMGYRAGAEVANMEFLQFHPTCLFHPHAKSFLISEALRGEGGVLKTKSGDAFMQGVHAMADLAPRDVVARAIDREMKRTGDDCVFLDMTHRDPAFIVSHFPTIHATCLSLGVDIKRQPIPVVPAAHYICGGLSTDLNGCTTIAGLWAAGETAYTGLHGANRLASNSLLEAAVLSERASGSMILYAGEVEEDVRVPPWDSGAAENPDEAVVVSHNWDELRRTMWNYVGIVRSDKRLERAQARVKLLQDEIREYDWDFKLTHDLIELRNLATVGWLIVEFAKRRRESRGLHYNLDTPHLGESAPVVSRAYRGHEEALVWGNSK